MTMTLALALIAGCGDDTDPQPPTTRSGSRIRAMYFVDDAGDRILRGWFDRALGVECTWMAGDHPPCLPPYLGTNTFTDPGCTQPVAVVNPLGACSPPLPAYMAVWRDPCQEGVVDEVWTVGEPVVLPTVYQYSSRQGTCNPHPTSPMETYYRAGRRLREGELVYGDVATLGGGRIRTQAIVGVDGSVVPGYAYDAELGATCYLDDDLACFPEGSWTSDAEDDACARPVAMEQTGCGAPGYIVAFDGTNRTLFTGGELITSDPAVAWEGFTNVDPATGEPSVCAPVRRSPRAGYGLYRGGAPVGVDLVPVHRELDAGRSIQGSWRVAGEHRELVEYVDRERGAPCHPELVAAGGWRCVPYVNLMIPSFAYADPACFLPIPIAVGFGPGTEDDPSAIRTGDGCGPAQLRAMYRTGPERPPGATYFQVAGRPCEPLDQTFMGIPFRVFEVGDPVTLAAFPRLTPIVE